MGEDREQGEGSVASGRGLVSALAPCPMCFQVGRTGLSANEGLTPNIPSYWIIFISI